MLKPLRTDWLIAPSGAARGYIKPHALDELWFHTGTACNLACPFCLEGSKPGDNRLQRISLEDARPYIDEAVTLGVRQFSFTGGEPFIVKDFVNTLAYAAAQRPCLVLTNGTEPLLKRMHQVATLARAAHPVSFRVSIDYPDPDRHDAGRGAGSFVQSMQALRELHALGFNVSVARQMTDGENGVQIDTAYRDALRQHSIPDDVRLVAFPDFGTPGMSRTVPDVTEDCMTRYQTEDSRRAFMCAFSKMLVKQDGRMRIYACTLVDDDPDYDQGESLADALAERVMMKHHRCYACFRYGSSCSEL